MLASQHFSGRKSNLQAKLISSSRTLAGSCIYVFAFSVELIWGYLHTQMSVYFGFAIVVSRIDIILANIENIMFAPN